MKFTACGMGIAPCKAGCIFFAASQRINRNAASVARWEYNHSRPELSRPQAVLNIEKDRWHVTAWTMATM